jgi:hypothetical protein
MGMYGNIILGYCIDCNAPIPQGAEKCPGCGKDLRAPSVGQVNDPEVTNLIGKSFDGSSRR